jgi:hypothetical protein
MEALWKHGASTIKYINEIKKQFRLEFKKYYIAEYNIVKKMFKK